MHQGIRHHFTQYGEITSISFSGKFAFIRFENAASSNRAIANRQQNIEHNGKIVNVEVEPYCPNVLNDHCLQKIFAYLCLNDLCSVADVCNKFKHNAQKVFASRFCLITFYSWGFMHSGITKNKKQLRDESIISSSYTDRNSKKRSNQQLKNVFQNFGQFIKVLTTASVSGDYEDRILQHFASYSPNENCELIKLEVQHLNLKAQMVQQLVPKLARLRSLKIRYIKRSQFFDIGQLIGRGCQDLVQMELPYTMLPHIDQKIGKLADISLYSGDGAMTEFDDFAFERFVQSNPQLKKLLIFMSSKKKSNFLRNIGSYLHELEDLSITGKCKGINLDGNDLAQLKKLKSLYFDCAGLPAATFFSALANGKVPVETLILREMTLGPGVAKSMTKMEQIKKIELHRTKYFGGRIHFVVKDTSVLVTLAKGLPHLRELVADLDSGVSKEEIMEILTVANELTHVWLEANGRLNTDEFLKIANLVKNRNNGTKLVVERGPMLDVPKNIIMENRQWLQFR